MGTGGRAGAVTVPGPPQGGEPIGDERSRNRAILLQEAAGEVQATASPWRYSARRNPSCRQAWSSRVHEVAVRAQHLSRREPLACCRRRRRSPASAASPGSGCRAPGSPSRRPASGATDVARGGRRSRGRATDRGSTRRTRGRGLGVLDVQNLPEPELVRSRPGRPPRGNRSRDASAVVGEAWEGELTSVAPADERATCRLVTIVRSSTSHPVPTHCMSGWPATLIRPTARAADASRLLEASRRARQTSLSLSRKSSRARSCTIANTGRPTRNTIVSSCTCPERDRSSRAARSRRSGASLSRVETPPRSRTPRSSRASDASLDSMRATAARSAPSGMTGTFRSAVTRPRVYWNGAG